MDIHDDHTHIPPKDISDDDMSFDDSMEQTEDESPQFKISLKTHLSPSLIPIDGGKAFNEIAYIDR